MEQIKAETKLPQLADDILMVIFLTENVHNLDQVWLKFVQIGSIKIKSALVQMMAWCRTVDKPFSEPIIAEFIGP